MYNTMDNKERNEQYLLCCESIHKLGYRCPPFIQFVWCYVLLSCIIQICSGITHGRVLSGELYAEIKEVIIYLHCKLLFHEISPQTTGLKRNLHETVYRQMQVN